MLNLLISQFSVLRSDSDSDKRDHDFTYENERERVMIYVSSSRLACVVRVFLGCEFIVEFLVGYVFVVECMLVGRSRRLAFRVLKNL